MVLRKDEVREHATICKIQKNNTRKGNTAIEERQVVTTNEGMLKENGVRDGKFCYRKREDGRHAKRTGETEKKISKRNIKIPHASNTSRK